MPYTCFLTLEPSSSQLHCPTRDLSVIHWFCFDFLVCFLEPRSQASCLPSVRELLRNGQETWLERCPGPHIRAPLLECRWLSHSTKERWPDYCLQSSLGYSGRKCPPWEGVYRQGPIARESCWETRKGTGTCPCLLLSPRARNWAGLSSVL